MYRLLLLALLALSSGALVYSIASDRPSAAEAKSDYVEECMGAGGSESYCGCLWAWYDRHVDTDDIPARQAALVRADLHCDSVAQDGYVSLCVAYGASRSHCGCVWRWFVSHVPRERALEIAGQTARDPNFRAPETVEASRRCG